MIGTAAIDALWHQRTSWHRPDAARAATLGPNGSTAREIVGGVGQHGLYLVTASGTGKTTLALQSFRRARRGERAVRDARGGRKGVARRRAISRLVAGRYNIFENRASEKA